MSRGGNYYGADSEEEELYQQTKKTVTLFSNELIRSIDVYVENGNFTLLLESKKNAYFPHRSEYYKKITGQNMEEFHNIISSELELAPIKNFFKKLVYNMGDILQDKPVLEGHEFNFWYRKDFDFGAPVHGKNGYYISCEAKKVGANTLYNLVVQSLEESQLISQQEKIIVEKRLGLGGLEHGK